MRVKFVNVFTVFVITVTVISPALLVFNMVWEKHIELIKTQILACEISKNCVSINTSSLQTKASFDSQYQTSNQSSTLTLKNHNLTIAEQYQLAILLQWFFLLIPILFGLGIIAYDRYLVYRAAVFQEQVEMLERLWRQSIEQ